MKKKLSVLFRNHKKSVIAASVLGAVVVSQAAFAIVAPVAGSLGFDLYDVAVNDLLKGPAGFVGGLGAVVYGVTQLAKSWMITALSVLGGSAMIKADTIVTSLGAMI